ncbi:hypothetical protein [Paenibacillus thiaminolyticus]|uniref:hypothetical protein n=1 Tax=Paenibacillus thiaminolyticus TaxID=49283 RepID=UPI002873BA75|nr:hypothetical protein [Paenibacillus thiaminolyticus]
MNREPTPADGAADLIIRHSIGEVLRWTDGQLFGRRTLNLPLYESCAAGSGMS